jgi:hypothetical protein
MAKSLAILSDGVRTIPQPCQANSGILLQNRLGLSVSNASRHNHHQIRRYVTYAADKPSLNKDSKQ